MKQIASAVGLVLLSATLSLLAGELLLRIILEPADFLQVTLVEDPVLGHRIMPHTTGHDDFGFRNARVPEQADVVAVGDSQTYGVNATRKGSWPHQLGGLLGQPVYSMAIGGYGPLDYLYLIQHDARKLRPKQILVGFYFGNDLMDACWAVEQRSHWSAWRPEAVDMCETAPAAPEHSEPAKRFGVLRDWMASHSVLYGVVKATLLRRLVTWEKDQAATQSSRDLQMLWVDPAKPSVHTIFTPRQRLSVLDPKLRGVQEGLRFTERALDEMRDEAARQGARLMIALIPTKERVYCALLKQSGVVLPDSYVRLCEAEEQDLRELTIHLVSAGIRYVDLAGPLQEQAARHIQIYPTDGDGHPLAAGYSVIAKSVYDALEAH